MLPGVDGSELIVIALVALIVIGPKDLPKLLRQVGKFVGRMRSMAEDFRASFDDMARQSELDDLRKEVEALRSGKLTQPLVDDVNAAMRGMESDINDSLREPIGPSYSDAKDVPSPDAEDHGYPEPDAPEMMPKPRPPETTPVTVADPLPVPESAARMAEGEPPSAAGSKPKRSRKPKVLPTADAPEDVTEPKKTAPRRRKTSEA